MHERRAGLGGLRNEYARGPMREGPSGSSELVYSSDSWSSNRWCSEGVVLGESSSRPDRHLLKEQCASQ